ncbi:HD-GYP domain-containing protein [Belnapia rosea]|uniref:HD-GYP domain-containing protein n=1 Tax=Belnapia rosea TaxID=938405 RepID=UPI000B86E933
MLSSTAISVRVCLNAVEGLRSPRLLNHESRVADLSVALGERMGLAGGHLQFLRHAASLHDIGKLAIPDSILGKPSRLDPEEWLHMQQHADFGAQILRNTDDATMRHTADIVLQHHEFWDGSGYPAGLRGDAILREARIINLCDVYDALREHRSYKAPFRMGRRCESSCKAIHLGDRAPRVSTQTCLLSLNATTTFSAALSTRPDEVLGTETPYSAL